MKWFFYGWLIFSQCSFAGDSNWESQIFTSEMGSCETSDLNFRALRFTKIPVYSDLNNHFLRIILFIRPDNTLSIRLTIQELLSCQTSSSGTEICSYRPLSNQWIESKWEKSDSVTIASLGNISFDSQLSRLSMNFKSDFYLPEVAGKSFEGHMVLVNFNSLGVNNSNLCKSLQKVSESAIIVE